MNLGEDAASLSDSELSMVGTGLGQGMAHTRQLKVLSYDEAMAHKDNNEWVKSCDKEHGWMTTTKVYQVGSLVEVPSDAYVIDSSWARKQNASGEYHAELAG